MPSFRAIQLYLIAAALLCACARSHPAPTDTRGAGAGTLSGADSSVSVRNDTWPSDAGATTDNDAERPETIPFKDAEGGQDGLQGQDAHPHGDGGGGLLDQTSASDSGSRRDDDATTTGGDADAAAADGSVAAGDGVVGQDALSVDGTTQDADVGDAGALDAWGPPPTSASSWSTTLTNLGHNDFGGPIECNDAAAGPDQVVFVCTSLDGLKVIDIDQPKKLPVLATTDFSVGSAMAPKCHHAAAALVDGSWRVWATWRGDNHQPSSTLTEVMYTPPTADEPAKLVETAHVAEPGHSFEGLTWQHNRVWLAAHQTGVDVIARVAGKLVRTRTVGGLTNAWDVATAGQGLAVADGSGGLAMIDSATPEKSKVVGKVEFEGFATRLVVDPGGKTAYVAAAEAGLIIVNLATPSQPKVVASLAPPTSVADVALVGSHALLAAIDRVYVTDVSVATAPTLIGARRTPPSGLNGAYHLAIEAVGQRVISTEWAGISAWQLATTAAAPALVIEARELHLQADVGGAVVRDVTLHNAGNRWLTVKSAKLSPSILGLTVEVVPTTVPPGGSAAVEVRYQSHGAGAQSTTLSIESDDPHEPMTPVALRTLGTPQSPPVAPTIAVMRIDGTSWSSAEHAGKVRLISYFSTFCPMAWNHFGQAHRAVLKRIQHPDFVMVGVLATPTLFNVPLPSDDWLRLVHFQDVLAFDPLIGFDMGGGKQALIPAKGFNAPAPVPVDVLIGRTGRVLRVAPRFDPLGMASDIEAALAQPKPIKP